MDPAAPASPRTLLITGTVGAGKTTTAYAVGDLLRARELPHAVIDLDELHRLWPAPGVRRAAVRSRRRSARKPSFAGFGTGWRREWRASRLHSPGESANNGFSTLLGRVIVRMYGEGRARGTQTVTADRPVRRGRHTTDSSDNT
nr:zeta toxin family protein [Flexivirga caeni]